jgi:hypothetical protein
MNTLVSGVIAAATGGIAGAIIAPILSYVFAEKAAKKTRTREAELFRSQRLTFLLDDLTRLFYLGRTETIYLVDALVRADEIPFDSRTVFDHPMSNPRAAAQHEKKQALIDRSVSNLKAIEAQAWADSAQLQHLLPERDLALVNGIIRQLSEPHEYSVESCRQRVELYQQREPEFTSVRISAMNRVEQRIEE